jgi:hypothetical protein
MMTIANLIGIMVIVELAGDWVKHLPGAWHPRREGHHDPIAVSCGIAGLVVYILSEPGMIEQQRKIPFPVNMWLAWPKVKRMLRLGLLTFIAAIAMLGKNHACFHHHIAVSHNMSRL